MEFDEIVNKFFADIHYACKEEFRRKEGPNFHRWIETGATRDIGIIYLNCSRDHLYKYMNRYTEEKMLAAGLHLIYGIDSYMYVNGSENLDFVEKFLEGYLLCQRNDINNWCRELRYEFLKAQKGPPTSVIGFKTPDASHPRPQLSLEHL
jgi:hypothetical protein